MAMPGIIMHVILQLVVQMHYPTSIVKYSTDRNALYIMSKLYLTKLPGPAGHYVCA